ncbi:GNAT family N-acetyltransferase [Dinoroseobacter sp. S375]|uniref:GNAT family N-acetyltransferase n=1 Tax=Dinoroseobacter sp. S375 TaxID=3415136 RepID=UPI003C7B0172
MALIRRVATARDVAAVDALLARSYPVLLKPDYPPSVLVTILPLISRAQPSLVTCGTYHVVEEGGTILAAGGWTRGAPRGGAVTPGLGHIRHVVTDHTRTREGLGRRLMGDIMSEARAAGMGRLEALSTLTAEPFYAAMGFEAREAVDVPIGPAGLPFRAVRMEASL